MSSAGAGTGQRSMRSRRRASAWAAKSRAVTHSQMKGGKFNLPDNPPDVTLAPWSTITCVTVLKGGNNEIALGDIVGYFRKQYDGQGLFLNKDQATSQSKIGDKVFKMELKLDSVKCWTVTGKSLTLICFPPGKAHALGTFYDIGTAMKLARVGYRWPEPFRETVYTVSDAVHDTTGDSGHMVCTINATASSVIAVHFLVHYRPFGAPQTPQMLNPVIEALDAINTRIGDTSTESGENVKKLLTISESMKLALARLEEIAINTEKERPSVFKKVIGAVEYAAMAITAIGDEIDSPYAASLASEAEEH